MNVYTYHQWLQGWGDQSEILELWRSSWERNGWNPVVLDELKASQHPSWMHLNTVKRHQFPSRNPKGYDLACWHRWFAFAVAGGGMMVDYDVINNGFKPGDLSPAEPVIHEQYRVPCCVSADRRGAEQIVSDIMNHGPKVRDGHYSDMFFFQDSAYRHTKDCREFRHDGWERAKLIHFATGACHQAGTTKVTAIRSLIPNDL
jgi:hypothetical protein